MYMYNDGKQPGGRRPRLYLARGTEVERFTAEAAQDGQSVETVIVSFGFGGPARREMDNVYWDKPKSAVTSDGRQVTIAPGPGWWAEPIVIEPESARIISSRHTPGMRGGYWVIKVAVPVDDPLPPSQ